MEIISVNGMEIIDAGARTQSSYVMMLVFATVNKL